MLRVASYNVHRCVGSDRRHDPERVAAVLSELDADVVGLQEVDSRYHVESGIDQIEFLAAATGYHAVPGPTLVRRDASYGNAVLSRHPVLAIRRTDISAADTRRERRGALDVQLLVLDRPVRFMVTHFGLLRRERRIQAETILRLLAAHACDVTVLCGDFNEWAPRWSTLLALDARLGPSRELRTFPSRWPVLPLDRIWVDPAGALIRVWVHRSHLAREASDHLPVCAALSLPQGGPRPLAP
jgi:endonuclease/exonuclease/phosphatase family metal-dependent hydrolase